MSCCSISCSASAGSMGARATTGSGGGDGAARVGQRHPAQDRAADVAVGEESRDLPIRMAQDEAAGPGRVQLGDGVGDGQLRRRDDGLEDLRALVLHDQDPWPAATAADGSLRTRRLAAPVAGSTFTTVVTP